MKQGAISRMKDAIVGTSSYPRHFPEFKRESFQLIQLQQEYCGVSILQGMKSLNPGGDMKKGLVASLQKQWDQT